MLLNHIISVHNKEKQFQQHICRYYLYDIWMWVLSQRWGIYLQTPVLDINEKKKKRDLSCLSGVIT